MTDFTQRLAIYEDTRYRSQSVCNDNFENYPEYARLSEFVTVTFSPRDKVEVLHAQVAALDKQIAAFQASITRIEEQKQALLSLEYKQ